MAEETGLSASALIRELLIGQGLDFADAVKVSEEFDRRAHDVEWLDLLDGTTFNRGFDPKETPRRRQEAKAEFDSARGKLRQTMSPVLWGEVDSLVEAAELALYRASECELGKMVDSLKALGRARTMLRLKGHSEALEKPFAPQEEAVFDFTDGTLTRLLKEMLSQCGCRG